MTGPSPRTEWLRGCLDLDDKGFILTGRDLDLTEVADGSPRWPISRAPQMLEASLPGVFAVGDVRAGNVKRVASAVGEGLPRDSQDHFLLRRLAVLQSHRHRPESIRISSIRERNRKTETSSEPRRRRRLEPLGLIRVVHWHRYGNGRRAVVQGRPAARARSKRIHGFGKLARVRVPREGNGESAIRDVAYCRPRGDLRSCRGYGERDRSVLGGQNRGAAIQKRYDLNIDLAGNGSWTNRRQGLGNRIAGPQREGNRGD
jgi:hypothetical protein